MAYVLRAWDNSGMHWLKLRFSGSGEGMEVAANEGKRFEAPASFRTRPRYDPEARKRRHRNTGIARRGEPRQSPHGARGSG